MVEILKTMIEIQTVITSGLTQACLNLVDVLVLFIRKLEAKYAYAPIRVVYDLFALIVLLATFFAGVHVMQLILNKLQFKQSQPQKQEQQVKQE